MQVAENDQPRRRSDAQRNLGSILIAGADVLARDPGASMLEIARAAGVHRATVHRHFASRDALVHAVRVMVLDDFLDLVGRHAAADGPPMLRLQALTRASLEHGDRYRTHRLAPTFDDASDERTGAFVETLGAIIGPAREGGDLRQDLDTSALIAAWGGLVLVALQRIGRDVWTVDEATAFVLTVLRTP